MKKFTINKLPNQDFYNQNHNSIANLITDLFISDKMNPKIVLQDIASSLGKLFITKIMILLLT